MYLLNAKTCKLECFMGNDIPKYAILSHTWGDDEVTYDDLSNNRDSIKSKRGYAKIRYTCMQALRDSLLYAWIDTCCINKNSSAELSEAINSMFTWYSRAQVCYAYLSDVAVVVWATSSDFCVSAEGQREVRGFLQSRWFKRGWTLQELLAPTKVKFYGRQWRLIGDKTGNLLSDIQKATGIDITVLREPRLLQHTSVAKRMSWASSRETTRKEDEAYCLLGVFGVNMPLLYGEGEKAFMRLQEAIVESNNDQSILVWGLTDKARRNYDRTLLAPSPKSFAECGNIVASTTLKDSHEMAKSGLRINLPILSAGNRRLPKYLGILNCYDDGELLAISLRGVSANDDTARSIFRPDDNSIYTICPLMDGTYYTHVKIESAAKATTKAINIRGPQAQAPPSVDPMLSVEVVPDFKTGVTLKQVWPADAWDLSRWHSQGINDLGPVAQFVPSLPDGAGGVVISTGNVQEDLMLCFRYRIQEDGVADHFISKIFIGWSQLEPQCQAMLAKDFHQLREENDTIFDRDEGASYSAAAILRPKSGKRLDYYAGASSKTMSAVMRPALGEEPGVLCLTIDICRTLLGQVKHSPADIATRFRRIGGHMLFLWD